MRRGEPLRALVRETALDPGDLIYPLFICPGKGVRNPVSSMPGVFNLSVDEAVREAEEAARLGLGGLLLFGLPAEVHPAFLFGAVHRTFFGIHVAQPLSMNSGSMTQLSCSELYKIDQWTLETWLYWTTAESLAPVSFGCARIIVRI